MTVRVLALLGGLLAGAAVVGVGHAAGFAVPWAIALPAGLAAGAGTLLARTLPPDDPPPAAPSLPAPPGGPAAFGDLASLRFLVETDAKAPARFETRLRPRLTDLAVERLWQRHRLDWRTDAGRAAALPLLGPGLTALLTAPPLTLRLDPPTLLDWLRELEDL